MDYLKSYDYVIKDNVVQIIVNRIDHLKSDDIELVEKSCRWKGYFKGKYGTNMIKHRTQTKIYSNIRRIITQIM